MNSTKKSVVMLLILCVFFPCLMFVSACGGNKEANYSLPLGTEIQGRNVYFIDSAEKWIGFMEDINRGKTFRNEIIEITNDISFKDKDYKISGCTYNPEATTYTHPTRTNWMSPYNVFEGTLNGNGHTLSNITINYGWDENSEIALKTHFTLSALFGQLFDATVTNLKISGVKFNFNLAVGDLAFRQLDSGDYIAQGLEQSWEIITSKMSFDTVDIGGGNFAFMPKQEISAEVIRNSSENPAMKISMVSVLATNIENSTVSNVYIEDVSIGGLDKDKKTYSNVIVSDFAPIYSLGCDYDFDDEQSIIENCYVDLDSKNLKLINGYMIPKATIDNEQSTCYLYSFRNSGIGGDLYSNTECNKPIIKNCVVKHSSNSIPICGYEFYGDSFNDQFKDKNAFEELLYYTGKSDGLNGYLYPFNEKAKDYHSAIIENCINSSGKGKEIAKKWLQNGGYCSPRGGINGNTYFTHKLTNEDWVNSLAPGSFNNKPTYNFDGDPVSVDGYEIKNDVWYYSEEFCKDNGDFPVLRNFIDWRKLNFNIANGNVGKVNVEYDLLYINEANPVYIPYREGTQISLNDQILKFEKEANSLDLSDNLTVYGQQIEIEILNKIKNYYTTTDKEWLWSDGKWNKIEKDSAVTTLKEIMFEKSESSQFTYNIKLISRDFVFKFFDNNPNNSQLGDPISESSYPSSEYLYDICKKENTDLNTCEFIFEKKSILKKSENGTLYEDAVIYTEHGSYRLDVEYVNDQCVVSVSRCGGAYGNPDFQLNNANLIKFHDAMVYDEYTGKKYVSDSIKHDRIGDYTGSNYTVSVKKYVDENDQNKGIIEYYSTDNKSCKYYYDTRIYEYVTAVDQGMSQLDLSNLGTNNGSVKVKCEVCIAPVFKQKYVTVSVKIDSTELSKSAGEFGVNSPESFMIKAGDCLSKYMKFENPDKNGKYKSIYFGNVSVNVKIGYDIRFEIKDGKIDLFNGVDLYGPVYNEQTIIILFEKINYFIRFYKAQGSVLIDANQDDYFYECSVRYASKIKTEYDHNNNVLKFNIVNDKGEIVRSVTYEENDNFGYCDYISNVGKHPDGYIEVTQDTDIYPVFIEESELVTLQIKTNGPKQTFKVENIWTYYEADLKIAKLNSYLMFAGISSKNDSSISPIDSYIGFYMTMDYSITTGILWGKETTNYEDNKIVSVTPENSQEYGTWLIESVQINLYNNDGGDAGKYSYKFDGLYCNNGNHMDGELCYNCSKSYMDFIDSIGLQYNNQTKEWEPVIKQVVKEGKRQIKKIEVNVEYTRLYTLKFENPIEMDKSGNVFETSNATGGSSWLTFTSNLSNVELSPNFTYVKGESNELTFNISTVNNGVKYTLNRYYAVDGLKLNSCLYKNGKKVHVYNEVVSGGHINLSKYGNVFTIAPVIQFNAIKVKIDYNTQINNNKAATINASLNGLIYVKDTPEIKNFSNTISGSMTLYFEYGSELKFETGENVDNIDGTSRNALKIIIKESGTNKTLTLTFTTVSTEYVSNQYSTRKIFNILHGNEYDILVRFKLA